MGPTRGGWRGFSIIKKKKPILGKDKGKLPAKPVLITSGKFKSFLLFFSNKYSHKLQGKWNELQDTEP